MTDSEGRTDEHEDSMSGDDPGTGKSMAPTDGPIDPDDIDPTSLTIPVQSLHPRIRYLWIGRVLLAALLVGGVGSFIGQRVIGIGIVPPIALAAIIFILGTVHALLRYRYWQYEVRTDALYLERGVITRVRTVVPFVRIQHVDTSQGPIERSIGLASSVVYTAGSRGADVTIPGLPVDDAEDLQARLKRLAIAAEGDTAV